MKVWVCMLNVKCSMPHTAILLAPTCTGARVLLTCHFKAFVKAKTEPAQNFKLWILRILTFKKDWN